MVKIRYVHTPYTPPKTERCTDANMPPLRPTSMKLPTGKRRSREGTFNIQKLIVHLTVFLLGCGLSTTCILLFSSHHHEQSVSGAGAAHPLIKQHPAEPKLPQESHEITTSSSVLDGVRILVAIAAFDFSQLPHLEDVLDGYHSLCSAGAYVDVVIHSTVPYPVALIDLLNSRLKCTNPSPRAGFSVTVVLKTPALRLFLVNCHRELFYDRLEDYDLFIYTEDDIRVTPTTVAAYLYETKRVQELVGSESEASNFNVGIVRYELNFPPDVIINDKTRRATENTTRVYWEHRGSPIFPEAIEKLSSAPALEKQYMTMHNHHQGMFLATRGHLKAWRDKKGCNFDVARDRPGSKQQHSEGTQRVWMSSQMMYGGRHCGIQQVLPIDNFGQLTVLHLPNKNYRRVGKKGRLGGYDKKDAKDVEFADGTEVFEGPDPSLMTAMQLHIEIRRHFQLQPDSVYTGVKMVNEVDYDGNFFRGKDRHEKLVEKRMKEYQDYVARGGIMVESDMEDPLPTSKY